MTSSAPLRCAALSAAIGLVWCGLLPAVQRLDVVARHVAAMESHDVNPAAMFYTELDRLPSRPRWLEERVTLWP